MFLPQTMRDHGTEVNSSWSLRFFPKPAAGLGVGSLMKHLSWSRSEIFSAGCWGWRRVADWRALF